MESAEKKLDDQQVESAHAEVWPSTITETDPTEKEEVAQRTDRHGLVLIPQPSQFKDDPLVSGHSQSSFPTVVLPCTANLGPI